MNILVDEHRQRTVSNRNRHVRACWVRDFQANLLRKRFPRFHEHIDAHPQRRDSS